MKKIIVFGLIFIGAVLPMKGQIYAPSGAIQGASVNDNVGIGTNQAPAKLTVQAGPDGYPTPLKAISIWGPNSPANSNSAQDLSWDFAAAGSASIRSYRGGDWDTYFQFLTNSNIGGNAPQVRMHIGSDGNVGIGTTNPTQKLDVIGTIKSYETTPLGASPNSFQLINEKGGSVGENRMMNRLWFLRDGPLNNWLTARIHDAISVDVSFGTPHLDTRTWWERDPLDNIQSWGTAGETYLTINAGNVGIGTTIPDEKLTVKGRIHAQEVKVDLLGALVPDYVFASGYKLKTLQEVEDYIKENKHLPEIPSAKEIEKSGLLLAEMNMSLLKKMEEMTLYMIEIKKENQKQNEKITALERKLKN
jgi:hypothetical protein